jgi:hypothetical protein
VRQGHEVHEDIAYPRLTRCDLFDNGELLWRMGRPQRHDEPATHFELLSAIALPNFQVPVCPLSQRGRRRL